MDKIIIDEIKKPKNLCDVFSNAAMYVSNVLSTRTNETTSVKIPMFEYKVLKLINKFVRNKFGISNFKALTTFAVRYGLKILVNSYSIVQDTLLQNDMIVFFGPKPVDVEGSDFTKVNLYRNERYEAMAGEIDLLFPNMSAIYRVSILVFLNDFTRCKYGDIGNITGDIVSNNYILVFSELEGLRRYINEIYRKKE